MAYELIDTMSNIEYGLLIAILLVGLLLFLIASLNSQKNLNVLSYIIGSVLVALLTFQMSRLIGGYEIYRDMARLKNVVNSVSPTFGHVISSLTNEDVGWFIFRRVIWSLIFIIAGCLGIIFTMDNKKTRTHRAPVGVQTGRRYTSSTNRRRR